MDRGKLTCSLAVLNRKAVANGLNGHVKASKVVVQLKTVPGGKPLLWVSSRQDIALHRFLVENVGTIWKNFIHEGKITIEMRDPQINLMIRDAPEEGLTKFLENLQSLKDQRVETPISKPPVEQSSIIRPRCGLPRLAQGPSSHKFPNLDKPVHKVLSGPKRPEPPTRAANTMENFLLKGNQQILNRPSTNSQLKERQTPNSSFESAVLQHRLEMQQKDNPFPTESPRPDKKARFADIRERAPYFPEPGFKVNLERDEMAAIRRALKTNKKELTVRRRDDYPVKGFSVELQDLVLSGVSLRRIDPRLLDLKNLQVVDLSDNRITSIECLKTMDCRLSKLCLDKNCIEHISDDLFSCRALKWLTSLSIKENKLVRLPRSIVHLENLQLLWLSQNQLRVLPYNMNLMRSLGKLFINDNKLTFLPFPMSIRRLVRLDMSNNLFKPAPETSVAKIGMSEFPTLFELAAGAVKTHNCRNWNNRDKSVLLKCTPDDVPNVVYDMLEACKFCVSCSSMVARYSLRTGAMTSALADETISQPGLQYVPTKRVCCETCA